VKIKAVNRMPRDVIQEQFAEIKKKTLSTHWRSAPCAREVNSNSTASTMTHRIAYTRSYRRGQNKDQKAHRCVPASPHEDPPAQEQPWSQGVVCAHHFHKAGLLTARWECQGQEEDNVTVPHTQPGLCQKDSGAKLKRPLLAKDGRVWVSTWTVITVGRNTSDVFNPWVCNKLRPGLIARG
jgi:hypothetical protein